MRSSIILVLTLILSGCAYLPSEVTRMEMTARDRGTVYYGTISRELASVVNITVEIDRRIYSGNFERTLPNATFGLYRVYGPRDAAPKSAEALSRTNYTWAILSSVDNRILTCDFTDNGGKDASGLCIDDARQVYDVILG
jgi:hypothetical protein